MDLETVGDTIFTSPSLFCFVVQYCPTDIWDLSWSETCCMGGEWWIWFRIPL